MKSVLETVNTIVWGIPAISLILFVGICISVRSKFAQVRMVGPAFRHFFHNLRNNTQNKWGTSGYRALCTALAATVGTGNIAGVAGAIALGGPGVVFWMWVCAILGMAIKFAEVTLAVHFRTRDYKGNYTGGPMHVIQNGLDVKHHYLAYIYCFFGVVASFGVGNAAQINAVVDGIRNISASYHYDFGKPETVLLGLVLAVLVLRAFRNESNGIGSWAEKLIPAASGLYIFLACVILFLRRNRIPEAICSIFYGALDPESITGGIVGSVFITLRTGISRGIFTNEAGMGTAAIAHASADVDHPVDQGMMGIIEVFLDTIVLCTLTALVILCSGTPIPYGVDIGMTLTLNAFAAALGEWVRPLLTILVCIFAFATVLGWGLYGGKCAQYIFGDHVWKRYTYFQAFMVILGTLISTSVVWTASEIVNGLMAIPNLTALVLLLPVFLNLLKDYRSKRKAYNLK